MYSQHDVVELVSMLVGAPTIEEQADILHYLVLCYGPRYKILAAQVRVIHILRDQLVFCLFVFWGGAVGPGLHSRRSKQTFCTTSFCVMAPDTKFLLHRLG